MSLFILFMSPCCSTSLTFLSPYSLPHLPLSLRQLSFPCLLGFLTLVLPFISSSSPSLLPLFYTFSLPYFSHFLFCLFFHLSISFWTELLTLSVCLLFSNDSSFFPSMFTLPECKKRWLHMVLTKNNLYSSWKCFFRLVQLYHRTIYSAVKSIFKKHSSQIFVYKEPLRKASNVSNVQSWSIFFWATQGHYCVSPGVIFMWNESRTFLQPSPISKEKIPISTSQYTENIYIL